MTDADMPWEWLTPAQGERWLPLPPAEPGTPPSRQAIHGALLPAANENARLLVLVGFAEDAIDLIAADRTLAAKDLVWLVRPGQLAPLRAALARLPAAERTIRVAAFAHSADLALVLHHLPLICWSLAVLDREDGLRRNVQHLRQLRLTSAYLRVERTLTDLGHLFARGDRLSGSIPLAHWKGRGQGRAALCLAAGPSLDRHLDFIRAHQDRCLVICADILHRRLEEAGIRVDFITNVDSHHLIAERLPAPRDQRTVLIMPLGGHLELDRRFERISYEAGDAIGDRVLGRGGFYARGTNVGCATVGFAAHLGCSEAILLGHDLSYARDSYYSTMIADPAAITAFNFASAPEGGFAVPGNDGTTVMTSWDFKLGIRDLGVLLEHAATQGLRAYNANAGHGIGALIPNTQPLPPGWTPPGDGPLPGSDDAPRLGPEANLDASFSDELRTQVRGYRAAWDAVAAVEADGLEPFVQLMTMPQLQLGGGLFLPFIIAHVNNLFRLAMLPGDEPTAVQRRATAAALATVLARAETLILDVVDRRTCALPGERPVFPAAFFDALRRQVPLLPGGIDEMLLPAMAPDWRALLQAVNDAPLPPPLGWLDGIHLAAGMHVATPRAWLVETLAHCRLDPLHRLDYVLDLARTHGAFDPARFEPDATGDEDLAAVPAVRALLRLETAATATAADAHAAAAWSGTWSRLIDALTAPERAPLLAEVVRAGALVIDDGVAARILHRHGDVLAACALLQPHEAGFGEGVTMAIAKRLMDIRQHHAALEHLERIRPLSRHFETALQQRLVCLVAAGRIDGVDAALAEAPTLPVAIRALHGFLVEQFGPMRALANLAAYRLLPIPSALLSQSMADCLRLRPPEGAAWAELIIDLARASIESGDDPVERAALAELVPVAERGRTLFISPG